MTINLVRFSTEHSSTSSDNTKLDRFYFHVTNQTNAGGSFEFPVANSLDFINLRLVAKFEDGVMLPIALRDEDGVARESLDPDALYLDSPPLPAVDPDHGAMVAVTLTGCLSQPTLKLQWFNQGISAVVNVSPSFSSPLVCPDSRPSRIIRVFDNEGMFYSVGTPGVVSAEAIQ
jgi:hypothetical protein